MDWSHEGRGTGGSVGRSSWIPIRGSILSLRRDLSRCIWESIAFECSEGAKSFGIQSSTLKWVLELARPYMPLVFHIRASGDNPQATDALSVQSLPIGNTCPEDIQRRLTPNLSDLLRHPEQMCFTSGGFSGDICSVSWTCAILSNFILS
jgi:hypothetical protein